MLNFKKIYPRHTVFLNKKTVAHVIKTVFADKDKVNTKEIISLLEKTFSEYIGTNEAIGVSSGRTALYLILKIFNYPSNSEIILSAYNFHPVVSVILSLGLKPIFVDIDKKTFNIEPEKIKNHITLKTKAILVTHMFGNPCDMDAVNKIAKEHKLDIIEDAAHAFGSTWCDQKVGSLSDAAFFSLSQGKNIAAFGGGIITTKNKNLACKIRLSLKNQPQLSFKSSLKPLIKTTCAFLLTKRPTFGFTVYPFLLLFDVLKVNYLIDTLLNEKITPTIKINNPSFISNLQAKTLLHQLSLTEEYLEKKEKIIQYLDLEFKNTLGVFVQNTLQFAKNYKLYYVIYVKNKSNQQIAKLRSMLLLNGIDTQFTDMRNCSSLKAFKDYNINCKNANSISHSTFEIPSDTSLDQDDLYRIVRVVKKCVNQLT